MSSFSKDAPDLDCLRAVAREVMLDGLLCSGVAASGYDIILTRDETRRHAPIQGTPVISRSLPSVRHGCDFVSV